MIAQQLHDAADITQADTALGAIIARHFPHTTRERFSRTPVALIQICVAHAYGIKPALLLSRRRYQEVVEPRQVAIYLARKLTSGSSPQLGRLFHRDHGTILHAEDKVAARMAVDRHFATRVAELEQLIHSIHAELCELAKSEPSVCRILTAA